MSFYFNSRYGLFTYSQCGDLDGFAVMDCFSALGAECIVGRELHENGGVHLHVFVDFGRRFRSRRATIFDVGGFHPNVSASRGTPDEGYEYAIKDGDVICGGLAKPDCVTRRNGDSATDTKWAEITSTESREEFWRVLHELDPKSAACNFNSLQKYADWKFADVPAVYEHPRNVGFVGGEFDGRDMWVQQSGIGCGQPLLGKCFALVVHLRCRLGAGCPARGRPQEQPPAPRAGASERSFHSLTWADLLGRCMSLCLYGESRTGKTLWARSLGPHIYCVGLVSGTECLKVGDVEYAVFDDIRGGIKFFPSFKEWLGCQAWVSVKCLYREPKLVKWGKPSIWISNTDPRNDMLQADAEWMDKNCIFIDVTEPIFHASTG
uniref:Replication-associated protein n=1 Tax=Aegithalos caudatus Genomoviridae sp. TaxID=2814943 RepID=A0A8A4XBI6_9VIRU